jgi:transglutaminase-like putative cysteine protease
MNLKRNLNAIIFFVSLFSFSQQNLYTSFSIPDNLKQNANAVVRLNTIDVVLQSSRNMVVTEKRIVTVLNKEGDDAINAYLYYDKNVSISNLEVLVYNNFAKEIKKIKQKDFKDVSAVDGGTLYSDSRVKYLDYTAINYPYTIEFNSKYTTANTAFIDSFYPVSEYFLSIENSSYTLSFPESLSIRKKEKNIEAFKPKKEESSSKIFYEIKNIEAFKPEEYSPNFLDVVPKVMFASKQFTLEGVSTEVENWDEFGSWMYNDLIKTTHDLSAGTINMVQQLVKNEPDNISKAKKIYEYVQNKVRYISVQVGIGGWKPFHASEVDKLGYGDCKALTNYTLALLKAVGIESNYSVVYAGESQRSLESDFAAMQGNHVILNIPNGDESVWLECTSQKLPFGFIGDFTDDRDVLVISADGGKIQHTKKYTPNESLQVINATCTILNDGAINTNVNVNSRGIQYNDKYWLETEPNRDLDVYYKKRWKYINNMSITSMSIENDKNKVELIENIEFLASNYTKKIGDRMLVNLNVLNRNLHIPDRYRDRKFPLKINRGFKDVDEVEITLPTDYKIESLPKGQLLETGFGSYKTEISVIDDTKINYKRTFIVNDGQFPKESYAEFRTFYKNISKLDNTKVALIKK